MPLSTRTSPHPIITGAAYLASVLLFLSAAGASGGAWTPEQGGGVVTLAYQYSHVQQHLEPDGEKVDVGSIDGRNYILQLSYGVTDRIAVNLSIPYAQRQYDGPRKHRLADEDGHVHASEEDNGDWHGEFQDFLASVQYQMGWNSWAITPIVSYGSPTNDYEHFAHAAVGPNQKKLDLGVEAGRVLPAPYDRFYVQLGYTHSFPEKYRHVDVDRSIVTVETGYMATDRLALRVFLIGQKSHGGLDYPNDFAYVTQGGRTEDDIKLFSHHDQIQRVDFVEGGFSGSYMVSPRTSVFGSVLSTLWGEGSHATDYALTVGVNRAF